MAGGLIFRPKARCIFRHVVNFVHPMNFSCINMSEEDYLKGDRTMAVEGEIQEEFVEPAECFGVELDEALCINYYPGKLAEIEDAVNEERDRAIADEFFCSGCGT